MLKRVFSSHSKNLVIPAPFGQAAVGLSVERHRRLNERRSAAWCCGAKRSVRRAVGAAQAGIQSLDPRLRGGDSTGFTFIELIVIIVIVSVALGTLLLALSSTINSTVRPAIMQTATELAEQELERITGTRFSYVCDQLTPTAFSAPFSDYSYTVNVEPLASDPAIARYKDVAVTVSNSFIGSVTLNIIITFRDAGGTTRACP